MFGRRSDGTVIRRPLSPHLQVYDMMQMTSALSISARATGIAWCAGMALLVWWLAAAASGPGAYVQVSWLLTSWIGKLVLFGLSAAAWFHTFAGLRHLAWDAGWGFDIPTTYRSGRAVLIATAVATVLTWLVAAF